MSRAVSPSTGGPYGVARVAKEWGVARSTYYDRLQARAAPNGEPPKKRGPKTKLSDAELTAAIRGVLVGSPFVGEGHRKAWARLRARGITTSKRRVLRLMREHGLLAPPAARRVLGPKVHDGTITTERPDVMWGTDATAAYTLRDGFVSVFFAVDHCTSECVGIHVAKNGNRFDALEPIRQGVRARFGGFEAGVATGLALRHDHGSQFVSGAFQKEIHFLGIDSSPSFVRQPEGNGCAERFARTAKEQCMWLRTFEDLEDLRRALEAWVKTYNEGWLVQRHGWRSPAQVRRDILAREVAA